MEKRNYREIPLAEISPNRANPRRGEDGPGFEELVASIRQHGVLEPIIVRPVKDKLTSYEVVAGERRYKAKLKLLKDGATGGSIPAVVMELTDDQAVDVMIIENLQREDLGEAEEAAAFKAYVSKHGKGAVEALAERTSISPAYIRRRLAVMALPQAYVKMWREGKIKYGHLEQLLRIKDESTRRNVLRQAGESVESLKEAIDRLSPNLSGAFFDQEKEGCLKCGQNSAVQSMLFAVDVGKKAKCSNPRCFEQKQIKFMTDHWPETPLAKKYKTNGFRLGRGLGWNSFEAFRDWGERPAEKCYRCENFVTIVEATGESEHDRACLKKECFRSLSRAKTAKEKKEVDPRAPRVAWHGEYFRDAFFEKRIPEALATLDPEDEKIKSLFLIAAIHGNTNARCEIGKMLKMSDAGMWANQAGLYAKILGLPYAEIKKLLREAVRMIVMEGQHVGNYNGFGTTNRFTVAEFLGIDLKKEWRLNAEYLQKKTIREMLQLGKKLGVFKDIKTKEYLAKKIKKDVFEKCKKKELVDVFLKSGVDLAGRVPDEVLKRGKDA